MSHPTVITSPSLLDDGTPFPTMAWLTCPWLNDRVSKIESAGGVLDWRTRVEGDPAIGHALRAADVAFREARTAEGGGRDGCEAVGIAGQRDPLKVKCLHAHVALVLIGIGDPVGMGVLAGIDQECADDRCATLVTAGDEGGN
jgi:hypothetical protein